MIEMRWVVRNRKDLPPEFNSLSPNAKESVLQYRQHLPDFGWSDWIDVPTVTESTV